MAKSAQTVLVVEDEPLIRLALVSALEDEGYAVFEAGTVLQAVAVLSRHDIDAVVTDVDMPGGLSGLDLADMIAGFAKRIAVIVTSGRSIQPASELQPGATFIAKPYTSSSVVEALRYRLPPRVLALVS